MIIGSELCYSLSHATYLARLIQSYLFPPHEEQELRYDEVIICQVRDREGFVELLSLLDDDDELSTKLAYTIEEVPEAVFLMAQRIERSHVVYSRDDNNGSTDDNNGSTDDNNGSIYRFPEAILHVHSSTAIDDSSIMFPLKVGPLEVSLVSLQQECPLHDQQEKETVELVCGRHMGGFRSDLISTDIAVFVILRVKAIRV